MERFRNIAIIALLALAIVALPGGGWVAGLIYALLSITMFTALAVFLSRLYRERRIEIYSLPDRERALLYGALALILWTLAASAVLLPTILGSVLFAALLGLSVGALAVVYRTWREY